MPWGSLLCECTRLCLSLTLWTCLRAALARLTSVVYGFPCLSIACWLTRIAPRLVVLTYQGNCDQPDNVVAFVGKVCSLAPLCPN